MFFTRLQVNYEDWIKVYNSAVEVTKGMVARNYRVVLINPPESLRDWTQRITWHKTKWENGTGKKNSVWLKLQGEVSVAQMLTTLGQNLKHNGRWIEYEREAMYTKLNKSPTIII